MKKAKSLFAKLFLSAVLVAASGQMFHASGQTAATPEQQLKAKRTKALKVAQRDFQNTNDRESAAFVGKMLDSINLPGGMTATPPVATRAVTTPKELILDLGNKVTLKLVQIPAGKFLMGRPETEKNHRSNEVQHEVTISKSFYMGVTHVTGDQFAAFVNESGFRTDAEKAGWAYNYKITDGKRTDASKVQGCSWRSPSFDQQGNHPVVHVSWNDARAFCDWLAKKSGQQVGLPTEAQWEYACRAGTMTAYPWGDNPDDGRGWANCADQSLKKMVPNETNANWFFSWDDGYAFTSPVASFKANAFGLYDMIGNAGQWCQDWYGDYKQGAATDPTGATTGDERVNRGSAWGRSPIGCRSANRSRGGPGSAGFNLGFRVVVATGGDTATPPADNSAKPDASARLKKVKSLFEQGLISKEDYDKKVKEIMDSL